MRKRIVLTVAAATIVAALIGGGVWWLFSSGRLVYVAEGAGALNAYEPVCDPGIVEEYNGTAYINDEDAYIVNADQRQSIASKIKSTDGFTKDPTCLSILFWHAISVKDASLAKEQYDNLVILHEDGIYPDPALNETASLRHYATQIESLQVGDTSAFGE